MNCNHHRCLPVNVLSLFDGISCCRLALESADVKVGKYYTSEIDKYATQIADHNYPSNINLGDCLNWESWDIDWQSIDLLTAGFPCQAWSVAGKQKGTDDPRGALVYTLIAIWGKVKQHNPDVKFLFENVRMKAEHLAFVNNLFGVEPIRINSNLVSAQNRDRYYWTNIEGVIQPEDTGVLLKDIVHENTAFVDRDKSLAVTTRVAGATAERYFEKSMHQMVFNVNPSGKCMNGDVIPVAAPKSRTLTTNKGERNKVAFDINEYIVPFDKTLQILDKEVQRGKVGYFRKDSHANRVYFIHDKAVTLLGAAGGGAAKMGQYLFGGITPDRINKRQNGQRFSEGKKFYTLTAQDKHGILIEGYIRKLTPTECERLQTIPDDYTLVLDDNGKQLVSNTQRYKSIGNGWTINVIAHIFKTLQQ